LILTKLTIKDFRQFKGTQRITFASDKHQNVTVIFGENGRGKTGILRAIMFCLYGERQLSQDENVAIDELYLVNSAAIEESLANISGPVEAYVELDFTHKKERYIIKRKILGMVDEKIRIEQIDNVQLSHWRSDGNTENYSDQDKISYIINDILNSNVKEYFLFDGEKIQRLTLANIDQKREVAKGIRNLLGIEVLEKAISSLKKLSKNLNTELSKKATGEYAKILFQLNDMEEDINSRKKRMAELETEYHLAETERRKLTKSLRNIKKYCIY
jgi:DNA sulfur modification protein DndD